MGGYRYRTRIPTTTLARNLRAMSGRRPGQIPLRRRDTKAFFGPEGKPTRGLVSKRYFGREATKKEFAARLETFLPPKHTASVISKHKKPLSIMQERMRRRYRHYNIRPSVAKALRNKRTVRKLFRT